VFVFTELAAHKRKMFLAANAHSGVTPNWTWLDKCQGPQKSTIASLTII